MDNAYTYDAVSNVLSVVNGASVPQSGKAGGQMAHTYTYDALYRLVSATGTYTGADNKTASYTLAMGYDNMHRITSKRQILTQNNVQFNGTLNAGYDLSYTYGTDTGKRFQLANVKDVNYRTEETPSESENVNNNHAYEYDANGNLVYVNTSRTKKDGVADEKTAERKLKWDEENRLLASDDNGFVTNYWYDADGERTVKTSGESDQVYVNSEFAGGRTNTAKFSLYVSPYLVANQGGRYTKHIYIGSQRVVSKIGDFDSYGSDPRRIQYAGSETDGLSVDYKGKYTQQLQVIKDNYATFAVPYNGEDNNDYIDGKGFCCNDGSLEAAQVRALSRAAKNNFQDPDAYEKMQFYYHPDHLGSSSYITNLDGEVVQHIEYVPFGEVFIEERNSVWNTPYLFNAKEFDEETGMYYYGARYYEPRLSLWMSTDGQQEEYPNISSYTYSASSPVNYVDPDGNLVIFVNGYYNTRSGLITRYITEYITGNKGGKSYWGVDFVNKATSYLNDNNIQFVDGRGKYNSSGDDRFNAGYKFAQSNYANISSTLKDGETVKVVSHSMGAAYSEGIIKYLLEQGISISQVIHFSPADPDDFSASFSNTLQLNINNDAVLAYKNGFSSNIINGVAKYGNVKKYNSL
nr:RHS repeat-associated core domain-containing protein [Prevotella sp.]